MSIYNMKIQYNLPVGLTTDAEGLTVFVASVMSSLSSEMVLSTYNALYGDDLPSIEKLDIRTYDWTDS